MSSASSAVSEGSTSACTERASGICSFVNPTFIGGMCSVCGSLEYPSQRTFVKLRRAGEDDPSPESWAESDTAPTVDAAGHGPRTATLVISSAAGSPARTSQSPDGGQDSP